MDNSILTKGSPARTNQETKVSNELQRLKNLEYLEEKHIESLSREFLTLKQENPGKYSGMSKETTRLIKDFKEKAVKGKISPSSWKGFEGFHKKFKEKLSRN